MPATGAAISLVQTNGESKFVVVCRANPVALAGHVKITAGPDRVMVNSGGPDKERLNTMPVPLVPPPSAVPYRVLPDKISPASGCAPSMLSPAKLCKVVKVCADSRQTGVNARVPISNGRWYRILVLVLVWLIPLVVRT